MNNTLQPNEFLTANQALFSPNQRWELIYQGDGNLVLYNRNATAVHEPRGAKWNSKTCGTSPGRCVMQTDGNLVIYDATGVARWDSKTYGNPNAWLNLQDDGNLVVYTQNNRPLWFYGQDGQTGGSLSRVYKFYVECVEPSDRMIINFKYGDIDPGKEVARVIVAAKARNGHNSVTVVDYDANDPTQQNAREEEYDSVNATLEQLQRIGNGDPIAVLEVATGLTVKTVVTVGGAVGSVIDIIKKIFP